MSQALWRFSLLVTATQTSLCTVCLYNIHHPLVHSLYLLGEVINWTERTFLFCILSSSFDLPWQTLKITMNKYLEEHTGPRFLLLLLNWDFRAFCAKEKANSLQLGCTAMSGTIVILTLLWRQATVAAEIASEN